MHFLPRGCLTDSESLRGYAIVCSRPCSMSSANFVIAVDVGTGSARAALFNIITGRMEERVERKIELFKDGVDFFEHSSE